MLYSTLAILAVVIVVCIPILRDLRLFLKFPSAPGPKLGALSRWYFLWTVAPNMYSIDDPEAVQIIYGVSSNMPKSAWYRVWGEPGIPNHNLFSALDRRVHAQMRRKIASMYSMTAIKSYEPYVENCISILLNKLDGLASTAKTFDLQRWMQSYAFDVIGEITFSTRIGFMESNGSDIDNIIKGLDELNAFSTFLGIDLSLLPILFAKYGIPNTGLMTWVSKLQQQRQSATSTEKDTAAQDFYAKVEAMRERDPNSVKVDRVDNAMVMNVAAGSDTTSITLTAAMFHLANHPESMKKLRSVITQATAKGEVSDPITFDEAQKIPYLHYVIKESMRLHAATGLPLWRVVQAPGETIAGQFFPAGAVVGINTWVAHYNQTVFGTDSHSFRPERWDPTVTPADKLAQMDRYFMPFGLGTRTCIGKNISLLEMYKVIPEIVKRYNLVSTSTRMKAVNHWFVKQYEVDMRITRI